MLTIYLFSILSITLFHCHEKRTANFFEADACEKAIYYGINDNHKAHFSKIQDNCLLCDQHTPTPQLLFTVTFSFFKSEFHFEYHEIYQHFHSIKLIEDLNKDPPIV